MLINENTSIAYLIKREPKALEAIVSLAPGFSKLRNPIIRKLMAGRTSIAMAAEIGGCQIEKFYEKLSQLGFQISDKRISKPIIDAFESQAIHQEVLSNTKTVELDVRPILEKGEDPLTMIMQKLSKLNSDESLAVINTFIPSPLIGVLGRKGYAHKIEKLGENHIVTTFYHVGKVNTEPIKEKMEESSVTSFMKKLSEFKTRYSELDLRHLEMPLPMTTILENLLYLPKDHILYVHHKRFPIYLVPELKDRGYDMMHIYLEDGVDLLIFQK